MPNFNCVENGLRPFERDPQPRGPPRARDTGTQSPSGSEKHKYLGLDISIQFNNNINVANFKHETSSVQFNNSKYYKL